MLNLRTRATILVGFAAFFSSTLFWAVSQNDVPAGPQFYVSTTGNDVKAHTMSGSHSVFLARLAITSPFNPTGSAFRLAVAAATPAPRAEAIRSRSTTHPWEP